MHTGYKYTRSLPTRSGSLYELLNSIHDLSRKNVCLETNNVSCSIQSLCTPVYAAAAYVLAYLRNNNE